MNEVAQLPATAAAAVKELMNLPANQRLAIGEQLLASVPPLIDGASLAEYRRRDQELEDGITEGIPAHEAVEAARQELRQTRNHARGSKS
jgi:hypothetical protein